MTVERFSFQDPGDPLPCIDPTERLLKYALVRTLAPGRRVLDLTCGDGYGAWLLHHWGATAVLGIAASRAAVDEANSRFAQAGLAFRHGDSRTLRASLGPERFDLILCYDAIEQDPDPVALLHTLRSLGSPDAVIVLTLSGDDRTALSRQGNSGAYPRFADRNLRNIAESALGPAQAWLRGARVQGVALLPSASPLTADEPTGPSMVALSPEQYSAYLLPNPGSAWLETECEPFALGVWGAADITPTSALSRQIYTPFRVDLESRPPHGAPTSDTDRGRETRLPEVGTVVRQATTDDPWPHPHSNADQLLYSAVSLQAEVDRLRRRLVELGDAIGEVQAGADQATRRRNEIEMELNRILSTRGYRMLDLLYYRLYRSRLIGPALAAIRRWVGTRVGRLFGG